MAEVIDPIAVNTSDYSMARNVMFKLGAAVYCTRSMCCCQQMTVVLVCMPEPFQPFQTPDTYAESNTNHR